MELNGAEAALFNCVGSSGHLGLWIASQTGFGKMYGSNV